MVNKTILIGGVGNDPEIKTFDDGSKAAAFSLATVEPGYTTKDGKEIPERVEWHNIKMYRGLAGIAEKYINKGSRLYIEGKLKTRSWEKDGHKFYSTDVVVDEFKFLSQPKAKDEKPAMEVSKPKEETNLPF